MRGWKIGLHSTWLSSQGQTLNLLEAITFFFVQWLSAAGALRSQDYISYLDLSSTLLILQVMLCYVHIPLLQLSFESMRCIFVHLYFCLECVMWRFPKIGVLPDRRPFKKDGIFHGHRPSSELGAIPMTSWKAKYPPVIIHFWNFATKKNHFGSPHCWNPPNTI